LDFLKGPTGDLEREFMRKFDLEKTIKLLEAANFMDIPALFELCCASIACEFRGKSFDDVKKQFGLDEAEYTPA
jgi:hypothetical protein